MSAESILDLVVDQAIQYRTVESILASPVLMTWAKAELSTRTGLEFKEGNVLTLLGMKLIVDERLPPDVLVFTDEGGNELGRVKGVKVDG
jgi:hypothetical protein